MWQQLIERRATAADAHDAVRARFPNTAYTTAEFGAALTPIAQTLGEIATAIRDSDAPPAEIARSWMWYGDAQFDLAQGGHVPFAKPIEAYAEAEPYVRVAKDPVLAAKRDGNLANILLRTTPGRATLRDIIARYQRALAVLGTASTGVYQQSLGQATYILEQLDALERELVDRNREARELLEHISREAHEITPAVASAMGAVLEPLARVHSVDNLDDAMQLLHTVQVVMPKLMALAQEPRASQPTTHGGRVAQLAMQLWQELAAEALAPLDADLRTAMFEVKRGLTEVGVALRSADPTTVIKLERTRLRDLAATARQLMAHAHLTWIEPRWSTPLTVAAAQTVHVAGGSAERERMLAEVCAARGLAIEIIASGPDLPEQRFNAIRRAAAVVIDMTGDAIARASGCYEAGIALVLGKPLVVLSAGDSLPFDIDVEPVRSADPSMIGEALDRALISRQRVAATGSLADLAAAARRRFPHQRFLVVGLDTRVEQPIAAASALQSVLQSYAQESQTSAIVAYPAWRRSYPGAEPRLFHIMPFRAPWSDEVKAAAKRATESAAAVYRRHDDVADPQILRSLWTELTSATHFLVDLTGMNPNVALELGVADALGTRVLVVGQPGTVGALFPMLRAVRVTEYHDTATLETACRQFVAG